MSGGRCELCKGAGVRTIEMNFLPDVYVNCEMCNGKRYNRETLEIRYKGKSIADVLDMTINEAVPFFESYPRIYRKLKTIQDVGLGYITLGQQSTTLSGGEAQRIKLATELARPETGNTLYILDEPTTGLHFEDIRVLLEVLQRLVDRGNNRTVAARADKSPLPALPNSLQPNPTTLRASTSKRSSTNVNKSIRMALYLIYLFATPALVMLAARKWTWIDKVSPMAVLYVIGLLMANFTGWIHSPGLLDANNLIGNIITHAIVEFPCIVHHTR